MINYATVNNIPFKCNLPSGVAVFLVAPPIAPVYDGVRITLVIVGNVCGARRNGYLFNNTLNL